LELMGFLFFKALGQVLPNIIIILGSTFYGGSLYGSYNQYGNLDYGTLANG